MEKVKKMVYKKVVTDVCGYSFNNCRLMLLLLGVLESQYDYKENLPPKCKIRRKLLKLWT